MNNKLNYENKSIGAGIKVVPDKQDPFCYKYRQPFPFDNNQTCHLIPNSYRQNISVGSKIFKANEWRENAQKTNFFHPKSLGEQHFTMPQNDRLTKELNTFLISINSIVKPKVGIPLLYYLQKPLANGLKCILKRSFDILFSLLVILLLLSWLIPILALLIKIESPGPILFIQKRSGLNNKAFPCLKLRSMYVNEKADIQQAIQNDPRITPIGAFMRKTGIDELPQFLNVLWGHMSVIGPRPHMLRHTEEYSQQIHQFMIRQILRPGISGWAQVNGLRGEIKTLTDMRNRVKADLWYMENWTFLLDVKIIIRTILILAKG